MEPYQRRLAPVRAVVPLIIIIIIINIAWINADVTFMCLQDIEVDCVVDVSKEKTVSFIRAKMRLIL
jgi:hypothetical protein